MTAAQQVVQYVAKHGGAVLVATAWYEDGWQVRNLSDTLCADWHADGDALAYALPDLDHVQPHPLHVARVVADGDDLYVYAGDASATMVLHLSPLWTADLQAQADAWAKARGPLAEAYAQALANATAAVNAAPKATDTPPLRRYSVQGLARLLPELDRLVDAGAWAVGLDDPQQWDAVAVLGWTGIYDDMAARVLQARAAGLALDALQAGLAARANGVTVDWSQPEIVRAPTARSACTRWLRKNLGARYPALAL
jgi:hypothetical protein